MKFSEYLRQEASQILAATYAHPFIQGIAEGNLGADQLKHYVKQDFEYLNSMIKSRGLAISRCESREDMEMFHKSIAYVLYDEGKAHENLCRVAGVDYEELQGFPLAPSAHQYISHMIATAATGSVGDIIAATLPCPWMYLEIGRQLVQEVNPEPTHPFYDWITIYGKEDSAAVDRYFARLDEIAEESSQAAKDRMRDLFMTSCRMEYMFFDMAYRLEEWPV